LDLSKITSQVNGEELIDETNWEDLTMNRDGWRIG
jgi:hypothetical protein